MIIYLTITILHPGAIEGSMQTLSFLQSLSAANF